MSYAMRKDGKGWRAVNSLEDVGPDEIFSSSIPIATLDTRKDQVVAVIRQSASAKMEQIAAPYSAQERESWATQIKEAEAFQANNSAPTPLLTAMSTARGFTVAALAALVVENANLYRSAIGAVLGAQQKLLTKVYAATSLDALDAITFDF